MSGLDQEFETGVRLIRDAFSRKVTLEVKWIKDLCI
jgi:hypothetical protein